MLARLVYLGKHALLPYLIYIDSGLGKHALLSGQACSSMLGKHARKASMLVAS